MAKLSPSSFATLGLSDSTTLQTAFSINNGDFTYTISGSAIRTITDKKPVMLYNSGSVVQNCICQNMMIALVGIASGEPPNLAAASFTSLTLYYARGATSLNITLKSHKFAFVVPLLLR